VKPDVAYARSGDFLIAYEALGHGAPDVLLAHGWALPFDTGWDEAHIARFYRRLAVRSRLILCFLAALDGPARAIRCACAIVEVLSELGIEVRAGLHTGECELLEGVAWAGSQFISVPAAPRQPDLARSSSRGPSEILWPARASDSTTAASTA
jgi:hypothetical protein